MTGSHPDEGIARRSRRDLLVELAHPPVSDSRFWVAQGMVAMVVLVHLGADLLNDHGVIPVPGFVSALLLLLPVVYAGTALGLAGSLAAALEGIAVLVPEALLTAHDATELWGELGILIMTLVVAVLIGDRFEDLRTVANAEAATKMLGVIHDSEERFRLAFDAAPIGMVITTRDGQFLQANAAFCHMVGRSAAEVTRLGVYGLTDPADIESTDEGQTFRSPQTPPNGHIGR